MASEYKKASAYVKTVRLDNFSGPKKKTSTVRAKTKEKRRTESLIAMKKKVEATKKLATKEKLNKVVDVRVRAQKMLADKVKAKDAKKKVKRQVQQGKVIGKSLIKKAVAQAPKGTGRLSTGARVANLKVKAQIENRGVRTPIGGGKVAVLEPARILRRPTQDEIHETDKLGLSFPSLHDEFKKTMSLLHGGDVGDSL